jgi:drug/metabolite transporter (DMT)-like permease
MIISAVVLSPFLPRALQKVNKKQYLTIIIIAIIGSFLPAFLYPLAQQRISSSLAGIINAFTPICTFGIGVFFFGIKNELSKRFGAIIAFIGALVLILFKSKVELNAELSFLLIAFIVPFLYGINSNVIKNLTALLYFSLSIFCIPIAIYTESFDQIIIALNEGNAFYHLLALSILGSAIAMALFNILIKKVNIMFAASVTYLMPIVALIIGFFDDEKIVWNDIVGLILILIGVLIMNNVISLNIIKKSKDQLNIKSN